MSWLIVAGWLLAAGSLPAEESMEGSLLLNKFRFESSGTGKTGSVVVSGTQTKKGVSSLRIEAFGHTFVLTAAQLQKLQGVIANSMRLSFWTEYPEYGGWRIHLWLGLSFASGTKHGRVIVVNEHGDIQIKDAAP
jgi:hypothetical protein